MHEEDRVEERRQPEPLDGVDADVDDVDGDPEPPGLDLLLRLEPLGDEAVGRRRRVPEGERGVGSAVEGEAEEDRERGPGDGQPGESPRGARETESRPPPTPPWSHSHHP